MQDQIYGMAKINAAMTALREREIDTSHIFEGVGFGPDQVGDEKQLVSTHQILQVFKNICDKQWHPHLPYEIGRHLHVSAYGLYGYAVLCSNNYRDTIEFAQKYHKLAAPTSKICFVDQKGSEGWSFEPINTPLTDRDFYAFLVNLQVGIITSLHHDVMGPDFDSHLIEVRYSSSNHYTLPEQTALEIQYGATRNRIHVSADLFDQNLELGNELTFKQMVHICETQLSELTQQDGISGQVKKVFLQNVSLSANMDAIASKMGLTSRTLRRQLKREDTTYSEIVDSVRAELALRYLREAQLSTEEIAFVLGFSEAASFVRAFKRWTGKTPRSYRVI